MDGWTAAHCRHHKAYVGAVGICFEEGKWSCLPESVRPSPREMTEGLLTVSDLLVTLFLLLLLSTHTHTHVGRRRRHVSYSIKTVALLLFFYCLLLGE